MIATLDSAAFTLAPDRQTVAVHASDGRLVSTLPLTIELDGHRAMIHERISADGRTLTLTPDLTDIRSDGPRPVASPMEEQLALNELADNMIRGPLIGTVIGTVLGALIGAAIGLGSCLIVGPGCLATTPAAIAAFAGAGGLVGTLVGGGAVLVDGLWKYLTTVQAPPGQSPYANQDGVLDPRGGGVPDAHLRLPSGSSAGLKAGSAR
ncbi:hypothetical protein [Nocardia sp. bgisy134]|uniref:hypothetical protein n=1 Tax=Nocardia sp. bgisy134 TaxID=3413789 RepID=UPI003D73522F